MTRKRKRDYIPADAFDLPPDTIGREVGFVFVGLVVLVLLGRCAWLFVAWVVG